MNVRERAQGRQVAMDEKTDVGALQVKVAKWSPSNQARVVTDFMNRPAILPEAEETARKVLEDIRQRGDAAVVDAIAQFEDLKMAPAKFAVTKAERMAALDRVDNAFKKAAGDVLARITKFSRAGLRKDWNILSPKGGMLGEQFSPLERVGCYIPGGAAPLASTALMTVGLAKVAGVPEIVACTPAEKSGKVNPYVLYALDLAGATEIYRIGGIQAIGAMAYGTKSIRPVQKIVGPGGPYVTAAKRLVYGTVDLDMVAGPSEVAILADDSAIPGHVAADLLAQAEHGTGLERSLLVTSSPQLAYAVADELPKQAAELSRTDAIRKVLATGTLIVIVDNLDLGMDLVNQFAPEHFEIIVREPRMWLMKVKRAGAVFIGPWTPECAGDFAAGPSHVLPTGGTAAMFSGLTVDAFRRRTSYVSFTRADLQDALPAIEEFSKVERLDGHARSARIRFEK
jgi:histidinol dehydrogenase